MRVNLYQAEVVRKDACMGGRLTGDPGDLRALAAHADQVVVEAI